MTSVDTRYLSDTAICSRCGVDLLIEEATFCPMCGEARVPGASTPAGAPPLERVDARFASPSPPAEFAPARTAEAAGSAELTPPNDEGDSRPTAPRPTFDIVDDEGPPTTWAGEPDETEATDDLASPGVEQSRRERRHRNAGARLSRLAVGDFIAAGASGIVAILLFLPWFQQKVGTVSLPRSSTRSRGQSAVRSVDSLGTGLWHWAIFVIALLVIVYVATRMYPGRGARLPLPHWQLLAVATSVNAALVLLSVGLPPDSGHWSLALAAVLAVIASLIALAGALLRRGDPEVITPGWTLRAARAAHAARARRARIGARGRRSARVDRTAREARHDPSDAADPSDSYGPSDLSDISTVEPFGGRTDQAVLSARSGSPHEYGVRQTSPEVDDDLACRFCGTLNTPVARVCRGCGVVMAVQLEQR